MGERFVTIKEAASIVSLSRAEIYRRVARDEFPKPVRLGRRVAFVERELSEWQRRVIEQRDMAS